MDLFRSPPEDRDSPGLAANDSAMLFPIAGAALAAFFYVNQQDNLLDEYLAKAPKKVDNVPVAQVPLRYPGSGGEPFNFRAVSEQEKVAREDAIVAMVRKIHADLGAFQGNFQEITAGDPEAAEKARQARVDGKPVPQNDAPFWAKKYVLTNLFADEAPYTRYLPLSFLANTVEPEGRTTLFHGGIESLTIEVNKDILRVQNTENMAIRMYGTAVDTNWRNMGQSVRKKVHFIYTQDENRLADMRILTKAKSKGGVIDTGVVLTSFGINVYPQAVSFSTDVFKRFRKEGLHLAANSLYENSIRLVHDKGAVLVHMMRAFSRIFQSSYDRCDTWLEVGGKLPLVLRVNDQLIKVNRVLLSSDQKRFPDPDLSWTSVKLKGVCFETDRGIVYQNTSGGDWLVKEAVDLSIDASTKIDLIAFSSQAQVDALPQNLAQSKFSFEDFDSVRYTVKSSLDLHRYNEVRAEEPSLRIDTPEVSPQRIEFKGSIEGYGGGILALCIFVIFTLFTWVRASGNVAWRLGQATAVLGGLFFVLSIVSFISVRFKVIRWLQINHDELLYWVVIALFVLSALTISSALRFNHSVPAGIYVMAVLLLGSIALLRATPIETEEQLTDSMVAWRSAIIIVIFKAGMLLTWESFKLGLKSRVTKPTNITTGLKFTDPSTGIVLLGLLLIYPLYKMLLSVERPGCEAKKLRREWLEERMGKTEDPKLKLQYERELENLEMCPSGLKNSIENVSGKALGIIMVVSLALLYIGAPVIALVTRKIVPSKHVIYEAKFRQDSRLKMIYTVGKTLVSLALLVISISILTPKMDFYPSQNNICNTARRSIDQIKKQFDTDADREFFGYDKKREQIRDEFEGLRCTDSRTNSIVGVIIVLLGVWMVSIVTPPRFSNTPSESSLIEGGLFSLFFFLVSISLIFINDKSNLRKALEKDAAQLVQQVVSIFVPP